MGDVTLCFFRFNFFFKFMSQQNIRYISVKYVQNMINIDFELVLIFKARLFPI
jgi:hypothetical protein